MRINTNISAIQAQRSMQQISREVESSAKNLASGARINSASDDAAGLSISEKMKATIRSANQAKRNANDGVSIIQTLEGSFNEVSSIFIRLKELAVQSATDTLEDENRQLIDYEFEQLKTEARRIFSTLRVAGSSLDLGTPAQSQGQILSGITRPFDIHIGLDNDRTTNKITFDASDLKVGAGDFRVMSIRVGTKEGARGALEALNQDINTLAGSRAYLGALQNRLVSAADNLGVRSQNESAAQSVIKDADYAYESARNLKSKILLDASTSVLSQANGVGKHTLKLIG
jgi:flagellin